MPRQVFPQCPLGTFIYYIRPGDTLYKLARRFNTTVSAIANANPGLDTHRLRVAQGICIPKLPTGRPPRKLIEVEIEGMTEYREAAEGVVPSFLAMLKTIDIP